MVRPVGGARSACRCGSRRRSETKSPPAFPPAGIVVASVLKFDCRDSGSEAPLSRQPERVGIVRLFDVDLLVRELRMQALQERRPDPDPVEHVFAAVVGVYIRIVARLIGGPIRPQLRKILIGASW